MIIAILEGILGIIGIIALVIFMELICVRWYYKHHPKQSITICEDIIELMKSDEANTKKDE